MSLPEVKAEIAHMSPHERRHLAAYIVSLNSNLDPDLRRKLYMEHLKELGIAEDELTETLDPARMIRAGG